MNRRVLLVWQMTKTNENLIENLKRKIIIIIMLYKINFARICIVNIMHKNIDPFNGRI
jgi:hypothetical protein